jgi:hypothetical protein
MRRMTVTSGMVREQLARILASRQFARTTRLRRFLQFVVEQTLAGRTAELKEYSIAIAVFDKPDTFDPRLDAIVRVQARELRTKLDAYYRNDGRGDDVVIRCFAGAYAPAFQSREPAPKGHVQTVFWSERLDALQSFLIRKRLP